MFTASHNDYAKLSNDELLQLASERASLTDEAKLALDAEMHTRNLAAADVTKHNDFVRKNELRENRRRKRKLHNRGWSVETAVMLFWTVLAISLISIAYLALPARYHFSGSWEEAAEYVMFSSVVLIVGSGNWRRQIWFWATLATSSTAHLLLVHAWIARVGSLDGRSDRSDKLAILLGPCCSSPCAHVDSFFAAGYTASRPAAKAHDPLGSLPTSAIAAHVVLALRPCRGSWPVLAEAGYLGGSLLHFFSQTA